MEKEEYSPNIKGAIILLAAYSLLCPIIPNILLAFYPKDNPIVSSIKDISCFLLLILYLYREHTLNLRKLFSLDKISISYIPPMCSIVLGFNIILSEADNILRTFLPVNAYWGEIFNDLFSMHYGLLAAFIAVSIVAPLVEELLFRGIILRGFLKYYSVKKSIIVSALLFGIMHLNPWQFLGAFMFGILFGWWFVKTRSIIPCILGHALNNSLAFLIKLIGLNIPGFNSNYNVVEHQPIWFNAIGIVLILFGMICLIKLFNNTENNTKIYT